MFFALRCLIALACALTACKKAPGARPASGAHDVGGQESGFVGVQNGQLVLAGKPFYFTGSNFYRLALADAFGGNISKSEENGLTVYPQIDKALENYAAMGIKVIRLWGFACEEARGTNIRPPLINKNLSLEPAALKQLDYTLAAAGRHGLKVIFPLVNFEPEYCGMEWWVEHTLAKAEGPDKERLTWSCIDEKTHHRLKITKNPSDCQQFANHGHIETRVTRELFYTDPLVKEKFKNHIKTVLERTNPYHGRPYKEDPTIMAIEIANEPHTSDLYECMVTDIANKTHESCLKESMDAYNPGHLVKQWLGEMSSYIKSVDTNHLVTTGEEGYRANHQDERCRAKHQWINNGSKGVDFAKNAEIKTIDFMTTHLYPDNWAIPITDLDWFDACIIKDRANIARRHGKPIIMEESGFSGTAYPGKPDDYAKDRAHYISRMFRYATLAGYQGTMIWQAAPLTVGDVPAEMDAFTFPVRLKQNDALVETPEGHAVLRQIECMQGLTQGQSAEACVGICTRDTKVDGSKMGKNADGSACYLPDLVSGASEGFPSCSSSTDVQGGWGWLKDEAACAKFPNTAAQFKKDGGCSCKP